MSFGHNQSSTPIKESEAEKIQKENLASLGNQVAQAQATMDSLTATEEDIQKAKDLLESVNSEVDDKSGYLASVIKQIQQAESDFEVLTKQLAEMQTGLTESTDQVNLIKGMKTGLLEDIKTLQFQEDNLKDNISVLEEQKKTLVDEVDLATKNHQETLETHAKQIQESALKVTEYTQASMDLQDQHQALLKDVAEKASISSDLTDKIAQQTATHKAMVDEYSQKQAELEQNLSATQAAKENEWAMREGDISKREQILEGKRDQLVQAKAGLEQHFNKTINLVI